MRLPKAVMADFIFLPDAGNSRSHRVQRELADRFTTVGGLPGGCRLPSETALADRSASAAPQSARPTRARWQVENGPPSRDAACAGLLRQSAPLLASPA